jgi:hypothetical protein
MDQQRTQNIIQASEQLTESTQQAFRTLSDRTVSFQESNLRLTQNFLENWMEQVNNLTQSTREATETLRDQGQRQREAVETLSQEGTNAYSEFLNSALSFYQEVLSTASQVAQGNMQQAGAGTSGASRISTEAPLESGTSSQATRRIAKGDISMADISQFVDKDYEQKEFNELAEAPVDAIQGVSKGDAEKLQQAFNVKTVRDLAENKFVSIAQAIVTLSGKR